MTDSFYGTPDEYVNNMPIMGYEDDSGLVRFMTKGLASNNFDGWISSGPASVSVSDVVAGQSLGIYSGSVAEFFPILSVSKQDPLLESGSFTGQVELFYVDGDEVKSITYASSATQVIIMKEDWTDKYLGESGWYISQEGNAIFANVAVRGRIEATSGYIGDIESGWEIVPNLLSNASVGFYAPSAFTGSDIAIFSGSPFSGRSTAPFRVNYNGGLVATSASITGNIIATSGSFSGGISASVGRIGGFSINATSLSASNLLLNSSSGGSITASGTKTSVSINSDSEFSFLSFRSNDSLYQTKSQIQSGIYEYSFPALEIRGFGVAPTSASSILSSNFPYIAMVTGPVSGYVGGDNLGVTTASSNSIFIQAQHRPSGSTQVFTSDIKMSEGATWITSPKIRIDASQPPTQSDRRVRVVSNADTYILSYSEVGVGIHTTPTTRFEVSGETKINGDFFVDTNTLFVDSTNNRVGILNVAPASAFHVVGSSRLQGNAAVTGAFVVEGVRSYSASRYTLSNDDMGKLITASHTTTNIVVIPASAVTNFPIGATFNIIQYGASATSASRATADISLNFYSPAGSANPTIRAQYAAMSLIKTGANTWAAIGNII